METFNFGLEGLVAAYIALALILLSIHVYSDWSPWVKGVATLLVTGFCAVTYLSWPGLMGWPLKSEVLPSRLYLIGLDIVEPDSVYLWARDLDQGTGDRRPRAYDLPYSKILHQQAAEAGNKLRRNLRVIVEIEPAAGRMRPAQSDLAVVHQSTVRFVDAPQGLLPEKVGE